MQAMQMSFFVFLPSILLSGFMFPREAMPKLFYYIGNLIPLTYFLQILRGIVLKGIGLEFLWPQVLSLIVFIMITLVLSVKKFKKTIA
ncbi:ABC transporter permease [bacterium BFN5]|nr:ABC transporter permease [bacterium BFN5]